MNLDVKALWVWSDLEQGRVPQPSSDLKKIERFKELEDLIRPTLKGVTKVEKAAPLTLRPFEDEAVIQQLLQFKDKIPLSSRVLRPGNPRSS